ncbi:MAG TPA: hypothetical protein VFH67_08570, partial [bacterium]|nr:hypothetical protein [bacterium]
IFLWTSIPAIRYGIDLSLGRAESVPRHISQGRGLSVGSPGNPTMPNYSFNHARSGSNSCSASTAPLAQFDLAALAGTILTCTGFS